MRASTAGLILFMCAILFTCNAKGEDMAVGKGRQVTFEYTLTVDGHVIDSSDGKEPMKYTHGEGELIQGLAQRLEGMQAGDEKNISVPPEEAYGTVNQEAFKQVPRSALPQDMQLQPGMPLNVKGENGQVFTVRVAAVNDDQVLLDLNHPLAGKTLNFDVKIVSVQ